MPTIVDYGPVSVEAVLWAAEQVLRQHEEPASEHRATGGCAQCTVGGCRMLAWAQQTVNATARPVGG